MNNSFGPDLSRIRVQITFEKMISGYTVRRKVFRTVTVEGLDVRKDGTITGAQGRRMTSNNSEVKILYKKPRGQIFKEITRAEAESLGYRFI